MCLAIGDHCLRGRWASEQLGQEFRLRVHAELPVDGGQVVPHGTGAQKQGLGDVRHSFAPEEPGEDLALPGREPFGPRARTKLVGAADRVEAASRELLMEIGEDPGGFRTGDGQTETRR